MNREAIYAAAFARASAASWTALIAGGPIGFGTKSRRLVHWSEAPRDQMPCFYQTQRVEEITRVRGQPPRWLLRLEWFVYVATLATLDGTLVPSQQLNPILDALQAAFEPDPTKGDSAEVCTLGGLVDEAKIVGTVENFEGDLGDLGVLIIPVEIIVPA